MEFGAREACNKQPKKAVFLYCFNIFWPRREAALPADLITTFWHLMLAGEAGLANFQTLCSHTSGEDLVFANFLCKSCLCGLLAL